jgi:hypothetical protein
MPPAVPSTIFPTEERFVNVIREAVPGTVPGTTGTTFPVVNFEPEDKPIWLPDSSLRGSMAEMYDFLQGPLIADTTVGGPVYVDMVGHSVYNILGDYTQFAPSATPSTTLTAPVIPGATTLTVAAGTSFTVGMQILVGAAGSQEIVTVLSGASTSITLNAATPIRIAHASAAAVTNTTVAAGTYSHVFSLLNSSFVGAGNYTNFGQPPTHCWTDRTQVPATGLARQYAYGCHSALTFTGNSEKLLEWNGNLTSFVGSIAASPPTASISGVHAYPDFNSIVNIATTGSLAQIFNISEWAVTINRQVEPFFTNDGSQNPFVIGRGKLGVTGKLTFSPATDETALLYMLQNTQPQLQIIASNGLATSSPLYQAVQFDIPFCDFDTSKIQPGRSLFGYEVGFKTTATASTRNSVTATGWSGAYSPLKVTLSNAIPIF